MFSKAILIHTRVKRIWPRQDKFDLEENATNKETNLLHLSGLLAEAGDGIRCHVHQQT